MPRGLVALVTAALAAIAGATAAAAAGAPKLQTAVSGGVPVPSKTLTAAAPKGRVTAASIESIDAEHSPAARPGAAGAAVPALVALGVAAAAGRLW